MGLRAINSLQSARRNFSMNTTYIMSRKVGNENVFLLRRTK